MNSKLIPQVGWLELLSPKGRFFDRIKYMVLIFQIISAITLVVVINTFGKVSRAFGYVTISEISEEDNLGFNLIFRLLSPAIFISFLSIILYKFGIIGLIKDIWLIALWYIIIHFILLLFLNRWSSVNKLFYFFIQISSVGVAYLFYSFSLSRGLEFILPEGANFRTEIWFIIILYFYSILNNHSPDYEKRNFKKLKLIEKRYLFFQNKYKNILQKIFKEDKFLHKLLFSIMIMEDLNRPVAVRFLERMLFPLGFARSTGIMQIKSEKSLSDKESINLAQIKILNEYNKIKNKIDNKYELLDVLIRKYNHGQKYIIGIREIYFNLRDVKLFNLEVRDNNEDFSKNDLKSPNLKVEDSNEDFGNNEIEQVEQIVKDVCKLLNKLKKVEPKLVSELKKKLISSIKE